MSEFQKLLREIMAEPPYEGRLRALARAIGIDHSHLLKVLDGDRAFSPQVVGRVARLLPEARARELIKCYLREIAAEIAEKEGRKALVLR